MVKNIGLKPVKDFAKYILYTGFVENIPYPVSGLIIAPPERGKSSEVQKFEMLGAIRVDKTTAYGLSDMINKMSERELKQLHHFIILDLENMASMGRPVKEQFIAFIKGTTQEGMQSYHTAQIKLHLKEPKQLGFLLCTTPEDLGDKRSMFRTLSFLSRPIPFSYNYTDSMRAKILDFIEEEDHNIKERYFVKREEKETVELPKHYAKDLTYFALALAKRTENVASKPSWGDKTNGSLHELVGIRAKENLMSFLKVIALYNGRHRVQREDYHELIRLYKYMNFDFNPIE